MSNSFIALFLVCIIGSSSVLTQGLGKCQLSNSYTRQLQNNGVKFSKVPVSTPGMCGSEWQRFGSCCSADVSKYDARQRAVSADLIKRAKKQVSQLSESVSEYMESFKAYISSATPRHGGRARFQIKSKTQLNQAQKVALSNRMLTSLEAIQNWINQHKFNMVEAQNTCIQKLQRERSAAVCYTCSGRAHEFFTKNSLNMHEMTCRSIIKECANSWWYLIGFLDQVNKFNNLITQVEQEAGIKMLNNEGVSPAKTILNWADQNNLRNNLHTCKDGLCKFDTAKDICENFISIERPMYLHTALPIITRVIHKSKEVKKDVEQRLNSPLSLSQLKSGASLTSFFGSGWSSFTKGTIGSIGTSNQNSFTNIARSTTSNRNTLSTFSSSSQKSSPSSWTSPTPKSSGSSSFSGFSSSKSGRWLLGGSRQNRGSPPPARPTSTPATNIVAGTTQTAGNSLFNPLLCTSLITCISDKVVLTALICNTVGLQCTSPEMSFP